MDYRVRSNYKGIAREKLLGRYTVIIGAILIVQLIYFILGSVTTALVDTGSTAGIIMYGAIMVITGLIGAVFSLGERAIYMKTACGDAIKVTDIFEGFKGYADKAIILQFIIAIRCVLFMIPAIITFTVTEYLYGGVTIAASGISFERNPEFGAGIVIMLLSAVFIIFGLIGSIYVRLVTSQVFYILLDYPQMDVKTILKRSRDMMQGRKAAYLYLAISFIPILILGVLSMGVGLMYIQPYMGMTFTEFYMELASGRGGNIDVIIRDDTREEYTTEGE